MPEWMRQRESGVELRVRLIPRAARNRVVGLYGDRLKISLSAPPVGGAANQALVRYLAAAAHVAPSRVRVVAGLKDRSKTVLIETDEPARLYSALTAALAAR